MAAMKDIEWLPPLLPRHADAARAARLRQQTGRGHPGAEYLMASDWLPEANADLNLRLFTRVDLDHALADLVGLTVSQENSCRYCFAATRTLLIMVGNLTPPVGMCLFAVQSFSKVSLGDLSKEVWPYLVGVFIVTILIAYIPAIGTFLPDLVMGK